jgi:hypothetical protein
VPHTPGLCGGAHCSQGLSADWIDCEDRIQTRAAGGPSFREVAKGWVSSRIVYVFSVNEVSLNLASQKGYRFRRKQPRVRHAPCGWAGR